MQTVCANESGVKEKERARDANRRVGWSAQGLREGAAASGDARANLGGHPAPRPPGDRRHHDRAEKVFVNTFSMLPLQSDSDIRSQGFRRGSTFLATSGRIYLFDYALITLITRLLSSPKGSRRSTFLT